MVFESSAETMGLPQACGCRTQPPGQLPIGTSLLTDSAQPSAMPEASDPASDPASDGLEAIVTVTETLEELQLPQEAVESESRGAIYSIPIVEDGGGGSSTPEDPTEAPRTLLGNRIP